MNKKMTKRQMKAWRKRRQHVNARRKMANRAHNQNRWQGITDDNPELRMKQQQQANPSLMTSIAAAVTNMVNMWRRSGDR